MSRYCERASLRACCGCVVALCALSWSTSSASAKDACAGVALPQTAEAFGARLVLNGMGVRRATFLNVHVYVAGLYVEHRSRDARAILRPEEAKLITLRFVRDVSHAEMVDAIRDAIRDNAPQEYAHALAELKRFERALPELREGMRLTLAYRPQHGLEIRVNDKRRAVEPNDAFANLVFRAWLGPKPPDSDLKAGMLGAPCD